jgi:hypothetical protein
MTNDRHLPGTVAAMTVPWRRGHADHHLDQSPAETRTVKPELAVRGLRGWARA